MSKQSPSGRCIFKENSWVSTISISLCSASQAARNTHASWHKMLIWCGFVAVMHDKIVYRRQIRRHTTQTGPGVSSVFAHKIQNLLSCHSYKTEWKMHNNAQVAHERDFWHTFELQTWAPDEKSNGSKNRLKICESTYSFINGNGLSCILSFSYLISPMSVYNTAQIQSCTSVIQATGIGACLCCVFLLQHFYLWMKSRWVKNTS